MKSLLTCLMVALGSLTSFGGLEETIDFGDVDETFGHRTDYRKYRKCGTGFFITANGVMMTESTNVTDAKDVLVVYKNKAHEARVLRTDEKSGCALLKVEGEFPWIEFDQQNVYAVGDKLVTVGFTVSEEDGIGDAVVEGVLSSVVGTNSFKVFGVYGKPMVGAPVLNDRGFVIGILKHFSGADHAECMVLARPEFVLSPTLRRKLPRDMESVYGASKVKARASSAVGLVLAYDGAKVEQKKYVRTCKKDSGTKITVKDLDTLIDSAKARRTHLKGTGSGFFITSDGYLLTNHHVIDGMQEIAILYSNKVYKAIVKAQSKDKDIALLKVEGEFPPVCVSDESKCRVGEDIFVVGYPKLWLQGLEPKVTKGIISSLTGFQGDANNYQMDAAIQGGNSGGPVADMSGRIVGVSVATVTGLQNVNYAIKWSVVEKFLPKGVRPLKGRVARGRVFADSVESVIASSALVLNYAKGGPTVDLSEMTPDKRLETMTWIRRQVLYARLAKIRKDWKSVKEITDGIMEAHGREDEAKELNDLARDELGLHLVIQSKADGRDVVAKVDPVCGFKSKFVTAWQPEALANGACKRGFPVKARLTWKDDDHVVWCGELDITYDWSGTKEIEVHLKKEEMK